MRAILLTMFLPLAACAHDGGSAPSTPPPPALTAENGGTCRNDALSAFVGQKLTEQLGKDMLRVSGAKTMRSGGPDTAMTMDYREDRLTVAYDASMIVTAARCG